MFRVIILQILVVVTVQLISQCLFLSLAQEGDAHKNNNPLRKIYDNYKGPEGFHHWKGYAKHYHRHFSRFYHSSKNIQMLEIGVQSGGSSRIWSQYFGKRLNYTGFDINPACTQFEDPSRNIHIVTGSQLKPDDIVKVCRDFGPFDIIVDDGGHTTEMIIVTFELLFNVACLKNDGVYAVEDTHTMHLWKGRKGMLYRGVDFYGQLADYQRRMVGYWPNVHDPFKDTFISHLAATHVYDSMAFFNFQKEWKPEQIIRVGNFISYGGPPEPPNN